MKNIKLEIKDNIVRFIKNNELYKIEFYKNENGKFEVRDLFEFDNSCFGYKNKYNYNEENDLEIEKCLWGEELEEYNSVEEIVEDFINYFNL